MDLSLTERKSIRDGFSAVDAISSTDKPGQAAAQAQGFIASLPLVVRGYACTHPDCGYLCPMYESMTKHHRLAHTAAAARNNTRENVAMQTLFKAKSHIAYFEVEPPQIAPTADSPSTANAILQEAALFSRQRQLLSLVAPDDLSATRLTLWDSKTKWPLHFAGLNMHDIHSSSTLSLPQDPPSWTVIPLAVKSLLLRCHNLGQTRQDHVHRLFRSISPELSSKPLRFIHHTSFVSYFTPWQRMIMYMLRNYSTPTQHCLTISSSQHAILKELSSYLESTTAKDSTPELEDLILRLSMDVIKQRIIGDPFESPLIHWLGVWGYDDVHSVWHTAASHRPLLSRITYCIRILGLQDAFLEMENTGEKNTNEFIRQYMQRYLHDGSDTLFTTLQSQRAYAKVAAKDFYAHPSILWSADKSSLTYKGEELKLAALHDWAQSLYTRAREILLDELLFQPDEYLDSRSPRHFKENMVWATNGESFADLNLDQVGDTNARILSAAKHHRNGAALYSELSTEGPRILKG
jgi:hypothetical protein